MGFFDCKACKARDQHLASLRDEIRALRKQLATDPINITAMEANALLSGEQSVHIITPEEESLESNIQAEKEAVGLIVGEY